MFPPNFNSKHAPPHHGTPVKAGKAKVVPGGPVPKGNARPFPPAVQTGAKKKLDPGKNDPLLGLKNALKANQAMTLAQQVAESGG